MSSKTATRRCCRRTRLYRPPAPCAAAAESAVDTAWRPPLPLGCDGGFALPRHHHSRAAVLLPLRAAMASAWQTTVRGQKTSATWPPSRFCPTKHA